MEVRLIIRYVIYFVSLVLLQVLLFNYVSLGTGLVPYIYVIAILLLPIDIQKWIVLILSFVIGLTVDIFNDTVALHTSATLVLAFMRPFVIRLLSPEDGYVIGTLPSNFTLKFWRFFAYITILLFFHQLVYFSLDIFLFPKIEVIILKTFVNTIFTSVFVVFLHLLFYKNK